MIISFTENVATPTNFPNCCQNIFCFQSLCSKMVTKSAARRKYSHESWYLNQQLNRPSVASHFVLRQSVYNEFITPFSPKVLVTLTEKNGQFIQYACSSKDQTLWRTILGTSLLACMKSLASNLSLITVTSSNSPFFWKELAYILLIYL